MQLKDEVPLKTVLAKLKEQFGEAAERQATLTEAGGGYVLASKVPEMPVSLHAKFINKQLVLALGNNDLVAKGLTSITSGTGSLEGNGAYKAALASLPAEAHMMMWIDAGRIGDTFLRSPLLKKAIDESGVDLSKLKFTGDERVTAAISLDAQSEGDVWTFRLHALNPPALGMIGGGMALVSAARLTAALNEPIGEVPTGIDPLAPDPLADPLIPPPLPTDTATPPTTTASFKVGDKVQVEWHGKFYPSTILSVLPDDKFKIHFDGWSNSWDEVVPISRIKTK
jgi:hypothetical protein